jgi:eukaryotic-like serine/threonine-protein kinase
LFVNLTFSASIHESANLNHGPHFNSIKKITVNKRHWNLVKSVVDEALTFSGNERNTYLETVFQKNPDIADEVKEMLSLIEETEKNHFMQNVRSDSKELLSGLYYDYSKPAIKRNFLGKKIGNYHITDVLGIGGMGMVFRASRTDGEFSHAVAVKILKKGLDTDENLLRFRLEREILASLKHPNIAQIYDGGITDDGLPYLIMELIEGRPINEYCNERKLTVLERVGLFKQICTAVDFAHKNLVIHRDLKAPNIYVTENGVVKILDFGIAKLLGSENPNIDLVQTEPGRKFWTPHYASPEQVTGEPVTTAADIYALGVLLHYLLTDTYPLDLDGKNIHSVEQTILNSDPASPSRCISGVKNISEIAGLRSMDPSAFEKSLKGDLDALVLKSIRKEPEYRYDSVHQLIEDIERFETGKPLTASTGTIRYKAAKYIKRNRNGIAAAALFLISIIGFSVFYTLKITQERNLAQLERDKAEQVADFLTGLFSAGNPVNAQGELLTAVDLLEIGIERADDLSDQPLVQAEMLYTIGSSFRGMVMPEKAVTVLERALDLQRNHLPADHPDIAFTLNALGSVHWSVDEDEKAEPYHREALEMRQRLHGKSHPDVFTSLNNYALVLKDLGHLDEAENIYRENLEARRAYYGPVHSKVTYSLNNLAFLLVERGKLEEAERYYREGLEAVLSIQGDDHSDAAIFLNNLGSLLHRQGKLDEAEEMLRESIRIRERVYGENHGNVARALNGLTNVLRDKQQYDAAEEAALRSLQIVTSNHGGDHTNIATRLEILGQIYWESSRPDKAEEYLSDALQMRIRLFPEGSPDLARSYNTLGNFYLNTGQPEQAAPYFTEALGMFRNVSPSGLFTIASVQYNLGKAMLETYQFPEAESHLLSAYNYYSENDGISQRYKERALQQLITLYRDWEKQDEADRFEDELASIQTAPI